jgi:hypothetical protein
MPPSELDVISNNNFALPTRYNYAFPAGFKEVEQIKEATLFNRPNKTTQINFVGYKNR